MIPYEVPINAQRMTIGVQGENNVRQFLFDVTEWRQITGDIGAAEMVVQRNGDSSPYATVITMYDENTVSWVPTSTDTAKVGVGKIELMWISNNQTVKTKIFAMKVDPSLDYAVPDDSLDPWASWMPNIINADARYKTLASQISTMQTQIANPFTYKGKVAGVSSLPSSGNTLNDVYYVESETCLYAWNGTGWDVASMSESEYLEMLQRIEVDIAEDYDSTATYDVGDYCLYNGQLYRCIIAVSTSEEWTSGHWTAVGLASEVTGVSNSVAAALNVSTIKLGPVFTEGMRLTDQGKISTNPNRIATIDFIDVSGSVNTNRFGPSDLWYSGIDYEIADGYRAYICFYSAPSSDYFVSSTGWLTGNGNFAIDGNYMRICYATVNDVTPMTKEEASNITLSVWTQLKMALEKIYEWGLIYKGLLTATTDFNAILTIGVYNVNNPKTELHAPVNNGGTLLVVPAGGNASLSPKRITNLAQIYYVREPFSIFYRFCSYQSGSYNWQNWVKLGASIVKQTKWLAVGDSLTAGVYSVAGGSNVHDVTDEGWVPKLASALGYELTKLGSAGMGYTASITGRLPETPQNSTPRISMDALLTQIEAMTDDFNLVTIAFGANDYGTISGVTLDTIKTGCMDCINRITTKFPSARVVCITPLNIYAHKVDGVLTPYGNKSGKYAYSNTYGTKTLKQVADAIQECCDVYGIECINATDGFLLNSNNISSLLLDGVHPSLDAYDLIAKNMAHFLQF